MRATVHVGSVVDITNITKSVVYSKSMMIAGTSYNKLEELCWVSIASSVNGYVTFVCSQSVEL